MKGGGEGLDGNTFQLSSLNTAIIVKSASFLRANEPLLSAIMMILLGLIEMY
jgi:hypothetical protein